MAVHPRPTGGSGEQERRRRGLLWLWLAVVVVLLAGLLTAIQRLNGCEGSECGPATHGTGATHSTNARSADTASISIRVSGTEPGRLAPGTAKPVVVSVANTGTTAAHITSAGVTVGDASRTCTAAASIRVTHYDASVPGARSYDLAPGSAIHIPLTISMLDLTSNQNACKSARFPLTFHATAQQG